MTFPKPAVLLVLWPLLSQSGLPQTIETEKKPASIQFKDASDAIVTSIPVDTKFRLPVVNMVVSAASNTAYVLRGSGKSKERFLSAVNLATQRVVRVINIGSGKQVDLRMSHDGTRLFAYTLAGVISDKNPSGEALIETSHAQKPSGSSMVTVIDTASNQVVSTFDVLRAPGLSLARAKLIETFLSASPDGKHLVVEVIGSTKAIDRPIWHRLVFYSVQAPDSPRIIDPGKPIVSYILSENAKFLFVAAQGKQETSELVQIVNLENGKTINRVIEDPPVRPPHHRQYLNGFLPGARPSWAESKQGTWVITRPGLRFISETGEMGDEMALPRETTVAALLSLDRTRYFVAVPNISEHTGILDVVDLKKGTSRTYNLNDAPTRLMRLGSARGLWMMGRQEMRPISETGELGDRAILLNKPRRVEEGEAIEQDIFLDGEPGETIALGEDHAAILITKKRGESVHRVALLNLKELQLDGVLATMTRGERAKILSGRIGKAMGEAALEGAAAGALGAAYGPGSFGTPPPMLFLPTPVPNLFFANEALAARPDGRDLYVLDRDTHKVLVIDVKTASVERRIAVDHPVTAIAVAGDGKHLICAGTGFRREIDLGTSKVAAQGDLLSKDAELKP